VTAAGRPPGRLRRLLQALRPSRFELPIAAALVIAAISPLLGAAWLATDLARRNVATSLEPRVVDRLEGIPLLYGDLFQARKQLYQEQTRTLARFLPSAPTRAKAYLTEAIERTPRLRRAVWYGHDGNTLAEAEAAAPFEGGEYRTWPGRAHLAGGGMLECTFAVEARYFAEVDEARMLAEQVRGLDRFRAEVPRVYQLAFVLLLLVFSLLAAGLGIWLARRTTKRVTRLVTGVERLAAGDLEVRVEPGETRDEVHDLTVAFNQMVREVRDGRARIVYLEKISGWQEVARRLAHEIKNPLTPIQLAFQQLEARWKQAPPAVRQGDEKFGQLVEDAGQIVREEIGTLQRLVAEFSNFAKLPEVKTEPADLGEVVDEFLKTSPQLAEAAELQVVRAAGPCPVLLDRTLFRRVLANLCQNAVEASAPGRATLHLGVARTREQAVLTVADEGPGIERELRERIFDPYFTTKGTGTGLGLAIVKKIVLQHGGEIQAGQRPGGGASFTVALPLVPAPAAGAPDEAPPQRSTQAGARKR